MKKLILLLTIASAATQGLFAQTSSLTKPDSTLFQNYVFVEFGGAAFLGLSANYERFLSPGPGGLSIRAGIGAGVIPDIFGDNDKFYACIPLGISYSIPLSKKGHDLIEVGGTYTFLLGNTYYIETDENNGRLIMGSVGWRHTSASGKIQIRLTLSPYIYSVGDKETFNIPWIGFSVGHRF
jgi:hypothetical protein